MGEYNFWGFSRGMLEVLTRAHVGHKRGLWHLNGSSRLVDLFHGIIAMLGILRTVCLAKPFYKFTESRPT